MADGSFIEKDVRDFYNMLGLKQYDVRIVKGPVASHVFLYNENDFVRLCIRYNGVRNIYVGINERCDKGTKAEHVVSLNNVFIDIDSIRRKGEMASKEMLAESEEKANKVSGYFRKSGFIEPKIVFSGNGNHLYAQIPPIEVNDSNREDISIKLKIFGNSLRNMFSDRKSKIDNTFDISRVVGVPGTLSVKEFTSLRKSVSHLKRDEDAKLREHILLMKSPYADEIGRNASKRYEEINPLNVVSIPKKLNSRWNEGNLDYALRTDMKFRELYNGNISGYPSRSEAEFALIMKCMFYGIGVIDALYSSGIGKWKDSGDNYRKRTVERAESMFRCGGLYGEQKNSGMLQVSLEHKQG